MAVGVSTHRGLYAQSPVEVVLSTAGDFVTTQGH